MPPKPLDLEALMDYAGRSLAVRAQSLSELRDRLKRRAARLEDVAEVLARLKQAGYMNDVKFADSFAAWRRETKGVGKARVMHDLMTRRVATAVARKAVDAAYAEADEPAMIEQFLARKYRGKDLSALLKEEKYLASVYRKLRTAGFSSANSIRILKRYASLQEFEEAPED